MALWNVGSETLRSYLVRPITKRSVIFFSLVASTGLDPAIHDIKMLKSLKSRQ